jgi:peptidoglycan hydrolase-like protein with peptidoglycan-binding domain
VKRLLGATALALALIVPVGSHASASCTVNSTLTEGKRGSDQVRCLQAALNARGFNSGPVDGWFGPVTKGAVTRYQQARGLHVDGWVGSQTAGSLGIWGSSGESSGGSRSGRSGVNWDRVAQCESGGQWHHPPVTNRFGTFSGGLMMMNSAWRQYGGRQFAPLAYQASREQQIIVAERVAARVGAARAWQCPV